MAKRVVDKDHLKYVTTLPCIVCKAGHTSKLKTVQAHHLLKPYSGSRGASLKAGDDNVIPLCAYHHMQLHTKHGTESNFFTFYGMPSDTGQRYAKQLWKEKTIQEEIDTDLPF